MLEKLPRVWRNAALAGLGVLALAFAWSIRSVVNPLLVGYLLAYILYPIVQRLRSAARLSRRSAVNLVFVAGAVGLVLILAGFGLQLQALVRDVATNVELREEIGQRWGGARSFLVEDAGLDPELVPEKTDFKAFFTRIQERLLALYEANRETAGEAVKGAAKAAPAATVGIWHLATGVLGWILGVGGLVVLVPLYTYYLLFELERIHGFLGRYVPRGERARVARIGAQIGEVLANFFRGRLLVCLLKGAVTTVGLWIADIPYAFLLGMGSGLLSLVPAIGPLLGFLTALLVGVLEHSLLSSLVRTGIVFGAAELLEGYVLLPKILGDSLGLHPVVVLFALLAGGAALGLFGVLIALPLTAAIVILVRELVLPALERFADEGREGDSPILLAEGGEGAGGPESAPPRG